MAEVVAISKRVIENYDPAVLREKIAYGGAEEFAEGLIAALKPRTACEHCGQKSGYQRWAYGLFAKVTKLVQAEPMMLVSVFNRIGVRDEQELQSLIESGRRVMRLERDARAALPEFRDEALELLRLVLQERPEWRAEVVAKLSAGASHTNGASG
jgi:hypothetical protein